MTTEFFVSKQSLIGLIAAYKQAVANKDASFKYDGVEFLTAYAYYFLLHWCKVLNVEFKP